MQKNKIVQVVALAMKNSPTGEFMLAKRGPGGSGVGEWEFPGGKLEEGETQVQALIREIQEELSFSLSEDRVRFVAEATHQYPGRLIQIFLWFTEVATKPEFVLTDHDEVAWFSVEKIKEVNLSQGDKHFISLLNSI